MIIHVVKPGDSIYRIAQEYGVNWQYLIRQNELRDPNKLTPGQTIVVQQPEQTYTVKRGDTLGDIAAQNGTTVMKIWQDNPFLMGMDRIYPGQTLVLRFKQPKLGSFAVNGYAYPNIDYRILRRTLPYLTYISVFSYGFDEYGHLISPNADQLLRMAKLYQVSPVLVLTTLNEDGSFSGEHAAQLLRCKPMQQTLLCDLEQTLSKNGFSGVDVDFEYIPPEYGPQYVAFIKMLRECLGARGFSVSVSLAPKTTASQRGLLYEAHDYRSLGQAADATLLMTFEWGYSLSEPMAVAPINKVSQVLAYAATVIPSERIFLGIPNYGYDWPLPYIKGQTRARSIGNVQATEQAIRVGAPIQYDETAQSPHYNYWRERGEHEVWFEDARSIRAKLALAGEYRLRGVSIWNLMRWFPQLWLVLSTLYDIEKIY